MADSANSDEMFWVDPKMRGIIPLNALHVSRSTRKLVLKGDFEVCINRDFNSTVRACAAREETWINEEIHDLYLSLNRMGYAHSVEFWMHGNLMGGLYGVALGGAFFGESMFSSHPSASKVALIWLVARLRAGGFTLLDTQFVTDHLRRLGAIEIKRDNYLERLEAALKIPASFWTLDPNLPAQEVLQLSTQRS
jgi:leucyl/phenylalanyl-tRNA--protein transferase